MTVVSKPDRSMEDTFMEYEKGNELLEQRQDEITKWWTRSDNGALAETHRTALKNISVDMMDTTAHLSSEEVLSGNTGSVVQNLFQKVISIDNGLDQDQRNTLVEALRKVQEAWINFADTVASIFRVKTNPPPSS